MTTNTFFDGINPPPKKGFFSKAKTKISEHNKSLGTNLKKIEPEKSNKELRKLIEKKKLQKELRSLKKPSRVSQAYKISGDTVAEHRRRIVAREEYKAKKGELKVAQFISRQQLPINPKPAYRGLSDRDVKIKKKKSKRSFF